MSHKTNSPSTIIVISRCRLPKSNIDGLVQERHNSSVLAMESCLSCINPLISFHHIFFDHNHFEWIKFHRSDALLKGGWRKCVRTSNTYIFKHSSEYSINGPFDQCIIHLDWQVSETLAAYVITFTSIVMFLIRSNSCKLPSSECHRTS